jgi:hypothetical protein
MGSVSESSEACPFLVPVTADRMFMYPVSAFCRRPDHTVRVPASRTLAQVCCTRDYLSCTGAVAAFLAAESGSSPQGR